MVKTLKVEIMLSGCVTIQHPHPNSLRVLDHPAFERAVKDIERVLTDQLIWMGEAAHIGACDYRIRDEADDA